MIETQSHNKTQFPKQSKRFFRIGLKWLLALLVVFAMAFAFISFHMKTERGRENARQTLVANGLTLAYERADFYSGWPAGFMAPTDRIGKPAGEVFYAPVKRDWLFSLGLKSKSNPIVFAKSERRWSDRDASPGLTDEDIEPLRWLSRLEEVNLSFNSITDDGLSVFRDLKSIERLELEENEITDEGLRHLAGLSNLKYLSLSGNSSITDKGISHLSQLKNLETLLLVETKVTGEFLKDFEAAVSLKDLSIRSTEFCDEHADALLKMASLRVLDISATKVTDAIGKSIGQLHRLQELYVDQTEIGDPFIESISKLSLDTLTIAETKVSDASFENLKKLPLSYIEDDDSKLSWRISTKIHDLMAERKRQGN